MAEMLEKAIRPSKTDLTSSQWKNIILTMAGEHMSNWWTSANFPQCSARQILDLPERAFFLWSSQLRNVAPLLKCVMQCFFDFSFMAAFFWHDDHQKMYNCTSVISFHHCTSKITGIVRTQQSGKDHRHGLVTTFATVVHHVTTETTPHDSASHEMATQHNTIRLLLHCGTSRHSLRFRAIHNTTSHYATCALPTCFISRDLQVSLLAIFSENR